MNQQERSGGMLLSPVNVCRDPGEPEGAACWLCIALGRFIIDEQTAEVIGGLVLFLRVASFPL